MPAIYKDLFVEQGAHFEQTLHLRAPRSLDNQNLTGFSGRGIVRKSFTAQSSHNMVVDITNPVSGDIQISMTSASTKLLTAIRYFYVIELVSPDKTLRAFEGIIYVSPTIEAAVSI